MRKRYTSTDPLPKTARGRATRERLVTAACELVAERGVAETSLDDVIARAGASKSQLYHYFDDRGALLRAVIERNTDQVVGGLAPVDGWSAMRAWFEPLVDFQVQRQGARGCPIGTLVPQLAEADEQARRALADSFGRWHAHLRDGLESMRKQGELARRADPDELATATLAAVQGGLCSRRPPATRAGWRSRSTPPTTSCAPMPPEVRVAPHEGSRAELRPLFELAEDSRTALDTYLDSGRVLVALDGGQVVGHLQLTDTGVPGAIEIKNMAVLEFHRRLGVGRTLVEAAIELAAAESAHTVRVATAAADIGNLRFYQRVGFRMRSVERDAFTAAGGYPPGTIVDGIELRDRVWLDLSLVQGSGRPASAPCSGGSSAWPRRTRSAPRRLADSESPTTSTATSASRKRGGSVAIVWKTRRVSRTAWGCSAARSSTRSSSSTSTTSGRARARRCWLKNVLRSAVSR